MTLEFVIKKDKFPWDQFEDWGEEPLTRLRLEAMMDLGERKEFGIEMSFFQFLRPESCQGWLANPILNIVRAIVFTLGLDEQKVIPDLLNTLRKHWLTAGDGKVTYTIMRDRTSAK